MIDITKKYETRCGNEIYLFKIMNPSLYPIHGAILGNEGWFAACWDIDGKFSRRVKDLDLVEKV